MIISVEEAKELVNLNGWTDKKIERKLKAIEQTIRRYTNNSFQNRGIRADCAVMSQNIIGYVPGINVGDTIQISESRLNKGLHVVVSVDESMIAVDTDLTDESHVLVTKIHYPEDIADCAVKLLEWEAKNGAKVGIKSETLSRHSVTYEDSSTLFMGYPVGILNGLKLYRLARC